MPAGTRVKCVSFAPPPVFTTDDQELLERAREVVYIYIHNSDIVPRLSLAKYAFSFLIILLSVFLQCCPAFDRTP